MLTHVDKHHFHQVVKQTKVLTCRPTAWSISGAWARVLHVARSAVAMTAHSVTYCVVVPNIRFPDISQFKMALIKKIIYLVC